VVFCFHSLPSCSWSNCLHLWHEVHIPWNFQECEKQKQNAISNSVPTLFTVFSKALRFFLIAESGLNVLTSSRGKQLGGWFIFWRKMATIFSFDFYYFCFRFKLKSKWPSINDVTSIIGQSVKKGEKVNKYYILRDVIYERPPRISDRVAKSRKKKIEGHFDWREQSHVTKLSSFKSTKKRSTLFFCKLENDQSYSFARLTVICSQL